MTRLPVIGCLGTEGRDKGGGRGEWNYWWTTCRNMYRNDVIIAVGGSLLMLATPISSQSRKLGVVVSLILSPLSWRRWRFGRRTFGITVGGMSCSHDTRGIPCDRATILGHAFSYYLLTAHEARRTLCPSSRCIAPFLPQSARTCF